MGRHLGRPSPAMIVACLALFVALGGGAYAALKIDTEELARQAVTNEKIAKRTIKGSRIVKDGIKGKKIDEDSLAKVPKAKLADTAINAEAVDNKSAVCDTGTQLFLGQCWETTPRAAETWIPAAAACSASGGYLPPADQLRGFQQAGNALAATDEWTNDLTDVPALNTPHVVTVSNAGNVNFTNGAADAKGFHCVFPLVH